MDICHAAWKLPNASTPSCRCTSVRTMNCVKVATSPANINAAPNFASMRHCATSTFQGVAGEPTLGKRDTYQCPNKKLHNGPANTKANKPSASHHHNIATPRAADNNADSTLTRAMSPMRRKPFSKAPCEPAATMSATPKASQPTLVAKAASPSTRMAKTSRSAQTTVPPANDKPKVPQNKARRAAATACASSRPMASAIWRVPTLPKPNPATVDAVAIRL